jgi:excinuclease ABC subunit C
MAMNEALEKKLQSLPDSPGVYRFYDARGTLIYVGKARSLKNRVRQYFRGEHDIKVSAMVRVAADLDYIITDSEAEALTLESTLIKQNRPRDNNLLKDDKHFPYVRIDTRQAFPRVEVVRRVKDDGAKYFGPYLSAIALRSAIETVRDRFPVRNCKKDIARAIARGERPCLMHHIGKCCAPCSGKVSREEYGEYIAQVSAFLSGASDELLKALKVQMAEASEALDFERAALLRDRINAITLIGERQKAISPDNKERDVFALVRSGTDALVFALFIRNGKLVATERYDMLAPDDTAGEVTLSFIKQFYSQAGYVPEEIVIRDDIDDKESLVQWLKLKRGGAVNLMCPSRGDKKKLADMAYKNGMDYFEKTAITRRRDWEKHEGALAALAVVLRLDAAPGRIEAYDNSSFQGMDAVSAMIVFKNGRPSPKDYRRFRVKTVEGQDDFATMREVVARRFARFKTDTEGSFAELPDLILIDGGRQQLNAALEIAARVGVSVPMIGLAKRMEEIYVPYEEKPILLDRSSPALHLLENVRDEAHRFAITYHRALRSKTALLSVLDEIEGIGAKRKRALLSAFPSPADIQSATLDELLAVDTMTRAAAQAVFDFFHKTK